MPESRHRKINKARKRPRVAPSGASASASSAPAGKLTSNRNLRLGAIILIVVLAAAGIAYVVSNRSGAQPQPQETIYETTTDSGLKIHEIVVGTGASPQLGQKVRVHYVGTLEDGTEFDSSRKRGPSSPPAEFSLGPNLISAWNEALPTMKVGGKRKLWVPSALAYGARGRPGIPPNSTLIFEIELLGIP